MCLWNTKIQIKSTERAQFLIDHFSEPVIIIIIFVFQVLHEARFDAFGRPQSSSQMPLETLSHSTVHRRCVQLQVSPIWQKHHEVVVVVVVSHVTWLLLRERFRVKQWWDLKPSHL